MGESIFEGTITKWLKKAGDTVEKDEPLFEISTDKVDAEIPSPVAGVLTEIRIAAGATVEVNTVVAVIGGAESIAARGELEKHLSGAKAPVESIGLARGINPRLPPLRLLRKFLCWTSCCAHRHWFGALPRKIILT